MLNLYFSWLFSYYSKLYTKIISKTFKFSNHYPSKTKKLFIILNVPKIGYLNLNILLLIVIKTKRFVYT